MRGDEPTQPGWLATTKAIAHNTWRLSWRNPLTWLELGMLAVLTTFAAITTQGSPTAEAGAVQMFAHSYTVAPFALVLVIGQIGRGGTDEVAWRSRPIAQSQYYAGRFLGYLGVGAGVLGLVGLLGSLLMCAITHLSLAGSLVWSFWFILATAPSLVTLIGGCLLLLQRFGPGLRYFIPAVVLSLMLAFVSYKWQSLSQTMPHLAFWNPFPGFLALGLTLPPGLLGFAPISAWIWWNRTLYGGIGLVFLSIAIGTAEKYKGTYPLQKRRTHHFLLALLMTSLVAIALWFPLFTRSLSPVVLDGPTILPISGMGTRRVAQTTGGQTGVHVTMTVNSITGEVIGTVTYPAIHPSTSEFALNTGLHPVLATDPSGPLLVVHAVHQDAVLPGTAATLWQLQSLGTLSGPLTIHYQGRLLPQFSALPYPPFKPSQVYESMAVGQGRTFLSGPGTWMPLFLQPGTQPVPALPQGTLTLRVVSTQGNQAPGQATPLVSNLQYSVRTGTYQGPLQTAIFLTAPYVVTSIDDLRIYSRQPLSSTDLAAYQPYLQAWRLLESLTEQAGSSTHPSAAKSPVTTPGTSFLTDLHAEKTLDVVPTPVTLSATLARNILLISEVHPYQRPINPVTLSATPATLESAVGTLSLLGWRQSASPFIGVFTPACATTQAQACGVMAGLDQLYLANKASRVALISDIYSGNLPGIGTLSPSQIRIILNWWPQVQTMSSPQWAKDRQHIAQDLANRQITWARLNAVLSKTP
ncbi:hypothetical protein D2Q93_07565 [Alicyclobacillaceae bacterium I2511]|nr:hypothetical protein D2Q93_07565 [Alicyclobacillaceae bacterium I2511]